MAIDDILIVGAGGMGTWCAMALQFKAKNLHVVDFDTVSTTNLNRLPFIVGKPKVEELGKFITRCNYFPYNTAVTTDLIRLVNPFYIIDCSDNMETQNMLYEYTRSFYARLIRAGSNRFRITIATPKYEVWDDGGVEGGIDEGCGITVPQYIQVQMIASGIVCQLVEHYQKDYYKNFYVEEIIYGKKEDNE